MSEPAGGGLVLDEGPVLVLAHALLDLGARVHDEGPVPADTAKKSAASEDARGL